MAGNDLRGARERMGLSLDEVAAKTRIPKKWLEALESGDTSKFPPGPFLSGYTKQYRTFLGASEPGPAGSVPAVEKPPLPWISPTGRPDPADAARRDDAGQKGVGQEAVRAVRREESPEATVTSTTPRDREARNVRLAAVGLAAAALLAGLAWFSKSVQPSEPQLGEAPDQVVLVTSASGVGATVQGDGRQLHAGPLPAGKQVRFAAHDRLEVELDALDGVTLVYNGSTLKPLGLQSRSRRLVFVDDAGG